MSAYVDYAYYTDIYLGTAITETAFPSLARDASAFIDMLTLRRLVYLDVGDVPEAAKMAACAVAERMQATQQSGAQDIDASIKSETVGGWTTAYNLMGDIRDQLHGDFRAAAVRYLYGTGLMYAGADPPRRRC